MSLFHLCEYPGSEVYILASDVGQAGIIYNEAANMAESHPALASRMKPRRGLKVIEDRKRHSVLKVLAMTKSGKAGYNANALFFDELAEWPKSKARDVWDQLSGSSAARPNAIHFVISTAQFDKTHVGYEQYEYAKKVKTARSKGETDPDPTFLPCIYELPDDQDWQNPENWWPVLPSVPTTVPKQFYYDEFRTTQLSPVNEAKFRTLYLNQWIGAGINWISSQAWDRCREDFDEKDFHADKGRTVTLGIDLSHSSDLSSWVFLGTKDDKVFVIPRAFIPEGIAEAKQRRDKVPYLYWRDRGWIEFTPGNVIDQEWIVKRLVADYDLFHVTSARMDCKFMELIRQDLERNHGITVDTLPQTAGHMSPHLAQFERFVLNEKLRIPRKNDCLDWCLGNCVPTKIGQDHLMLDKKTATGRIDVIIAAVISLSAWTAEQEMGFADSSWVSFT